MQRSLVFTLVVCNLYFSGCAIASESVEVASNSVSKRTRPSVLVCVPMFPKFNQTFVLKQIVFLVELGYDVAIYATSDNILEDTSEEIKKYNLLERKISLENWKKDLRKYDIVLAQFGSLGSKLLRRNLVDPHVVFAVCFRGTEVDKMTRGGRHNLNNLFARADLILPVCDHFRKKLVRAAGHGDKVHVLHSAVYCDKFAFGPHMIPTDGSRIRIVTVGRLVEKKGHFDSISAVAQVIAKYPQVTYEIVGFGPLRDALQEHINALGMQDKIKLLGGMQNDDIVTFLKDAHIFLLPSKRAVKETEEGIPGVIYEAMSAGVPVVSTYHAGIPEVVIHGVTGLLAPEGDVAQLTNHLEYYIHHPTEAMGIAHAARSHIESWASGEVISKQMDDLFLKAYNRKRRYNLMNTEKRQGNEAGPLSDKFRSRFLTRGKKYVQKRFESKPQRKVG